MPYEFKLTRTVEFSDTDMAGIMHYSNFFRFMETAEHAFFRSLGLSLVGMSDEVGSVGPSGPGQKLESERRAEDRRALPSFGWTRVHAECDYQAPLRFEDEVEIQLL